MTNDAPCLECGFVYPYVGEPEQIQKLDANLGGLCPACFSGYPSPLLELKSEPGKETEAA